VSSAGVPRFAVLYGASTTNDFVVASLLREHAPAVLVSEEQTALDALRRVLRRRGDTLAGRIDKLAFFAWYAAFLAGGVERGLHERLGAHAPLAPQLRVHAIDDALDRVREAAPTFVLAMGTSILGSRWQSLGVPIVNVHIGIAPRYRGRFCWFWPVLEGNEDQVGVTVHVVSPRVDAGPVVLQRPVEPRALGGRSFAELLAAVTLVSRDLCLELLSDPARHLAAARPAAAVEVGRRAYLEPGLGEYLRFAKVRRGLATTRA
jgi:folate-dependent phosphoribosylglycinamide formyltransferase PurN